MGSPALMYWVHTHSEARYDVCRVPGVDHVIKPEALLGWHGLVSLGGRGMFVDLRCLVVNRDADEQAGRRLHFALRALFNHVVVELYRMYVAQQRSSRSGFVGAHRCSKPKPIQNLFRPD